MDLESLDSKTDSDYIDKKLLKIVKKSFTMFNSGLGKNSLSLTKTSKSGGKKNSELESVSDMITKMLGKDLDEKETLEFKLGLIDLIDNVESKYIKDQTTRSIINKVLFALLARFKPNE
ncbi:MAG: hypothetical protein [Asgard archaea virus SkuldV2]|nr:MAG: hypothetical protein [Asgard archaea virus SkuldV2]